jgi:hypothetical protein
MAYKWDQAAQGSFTWVRRFNNARVATEVFVFHASGLRESVRPSPFLALTGTDKAFVGFKRSLHLRAFAPSVFVYLRLPNSGVTLFSLPVPLLLPIFKAV